ncbi:aminotransferase class I/II-fold pyridoxal phosphate-dependent enzyme [Candidatus Parcubacteria bacterium]|nr:aminotransferase class I/II-fold pyridoxal phosphate-dependent enzyme [Candidatus Parcubacteria bacterium]
MTKKSRLPKGGENLFQEIKRVCTEAEVNGVKLYKLSIGQPAGSAMLVAKVLASIAVMINRESIHEYQDNGSLGVDNFYRWLDSLPIISVLEKISSAIPGHVLRNNPIAEALYVQKHVTDMLLAILNTRRDTEQSKSDIKTFAQEFAQFHVKTDLSKFEDFKYLPIQGIKPTLGLIPMACGAINGQVFGVSTMTKPGYPTPEDWANYLNQTVAALPANPKNVFRFSPEDIPAQTKLIMINGPHNPTGQIFTREWLKALCNYCIVNNIRIFNDGAYAKLAYGEHCALADVAVDYPSLSWVEAFSASKLGCNFTGWRVGAIVGSSDFIEDIATIKGNTDSGFFAPAAIGALAATRYGETEIKSNCFTFQKRQNHIIEIAENFGMKLAVLPQATFFNLWKCPKKAFGEKIQDAKHFNFMMIKKTGVVGVHFDPYIRYAVVAPVEQTKFTDAIIKAFDRARVEY